MGDDASADWSRYYARTSGREPRPVLLSACELLGAGAGRTALDLGCGAGTDTLALLERGWSVVAVDSEQSGLDLLRSRVPAGSSGQVRIVHASYAEAVLPRAHLVHAGYSLPFCDPGRFPVLWARIRGSLAAGGIFAGQLFGTRDSWADDPEMTFQDLDEVKNLLSGLEILQLRETEQDGEASTGPKHWHTFDIIAREPAGRASPAGDR